MAKIAQPMSANDRLKESFEGKFALSLILATCVHLLVFVFFPEMTTGVLAERGDELVVIMPLDDIPIPVAPKPLVRPAVPVEAVDVDPAATLTVLDFPTAVLLPPPAPGPTRVAERNRDGFAPYTVAPELLEPEAFLRHLVRAYPQDLRDARVGGRVELLIHIDEEGSVVSASIGVSSGYRRLDEAALGLVDRMRFRPALNRDKRVAVLVSIPLEFRVRD